MAKDISTGEEGRLAALNRLTAALVGPIDSLDHILELARISIAPMVAISIVDRNVEIVLAAAGLTYQRIERERSLAALSLDLGHPLVIENVAADPRCSGLECNPGGVRVGSCLIVPLQTADGYVVGALMMMDDHPRSFGEREIALAGHLAHLVMSELISHQPGELDYLTGALTRRNFRMEVDREYARALRYDRPATLIFVDIDGFQRVNAAFGGEIADEVLKSVANRAAECLRATDRLGRLGGEEFGMLLPETMAYEASQCAERLREEIGGLRFRYSDKVISVTASFGIAPFDPRLGSAIQWFAQADIALYASKKAGRNCVSFAALPKSPGPTPEEGEEPRPPGIH
ncbi:GGDEF domain-containing protein [Pelagibacterium halotolerans]|uniref:diguanylate cyclase n=1 Tax=Pelagibacterium halotolerans (strain DSM 22347 / JCM 15775 / CGMCC 1.7692 / B2) TaxID=1082931 RepID=G4RCL9_PELHB|nr:sensor domain-containing diguanylate cyclase [Pelagibacterium halotolerans]AEQ50691.1 GGDEF/PAS/PAC-domain containing protein [Pelagibacterium halotolerans B2]QJR19378.1 sensor domain-containing diguanylate cyclase [Pelagibacterium halotolerans]SDZ93163.1 diguanylate cyclase with GAF sensor [Pelagibacterium halotolerans]